MPKRRTAHAPAGAGDPDEQASTRAFWSGTITFGLVSIPVDLYPATRSTQIRLRMIGPEGRPLSRRYFSSKTDRELNDEDIVRGYEIKKDKFVTVSDDELEKLAPEKSRDIDLKQFVESNSISPLYFEHSYFLAPASESVKAYRLLAEIMEKTGQAGIATFVMRGKEYLVAIFAENGVLQAETMRFADELRDPKALGLTKESEPTAAAVRRFSNIIQKQLRKTPSRALMRDEQSEQLEKYASKKLKGHRKDVVETDVEEPKDAQAIDIMSVLKKSLERRAA